MNIKTISPSELLREYIFLVKDWSFPLEWWFNEWPSDPQLKNVAFCACSRFWALAPDLSGKNIDMLPTKYIFTKTQNMTWRKDMWTSKIRDISELRYNVIKWSRQTLLMLQNSGNCHLWMYKSRPFCCIIFTTKSQLQQPPLTALTLHWCFFWTPRWLRHKWIWENPCSSMGWDTNLGRRPEFPRQNFGNTLLKVKLLVGPTFVNSHDQLKGAKGIRLT